MPELYYEDLAVGRTDDVGEREVTAEEIIEFAEQYDPLPFHTDPGAAESSPHGGLIASGWHTVCIANRQIVDEFRADLAAIAGLGIDDIRFPEPVRPGDTLSVDLETVERRPSESDPRRGIVTMRVTVENQHDVTVLSYLDTTLVERDGDASDNA